MKGFVQQLLLYALIEGKHAGRYDLNRIRSPAVAIDLVGEAVFRQNFCLVDCGDHHLQFSQTDRSICGEDENLMNAGYDFCKR